MDILTYMLVLLVSFLGLLIGLIISSMTLEEINHVSKYLNWLNILIVPLIVFVATFRINIIYSLIFTICTLILLVLFRNKYNDAWTYSCMGALLYISTLSNQVLNTAGLIFIYGISIATINVSNNVKRNQESIKLSEKISLIKKLLVKYSYYLLIGILFYVVFSYTL